jgi:serine protease Do
MFRAAFFALALLTAGCTAAPGFAQGVAGGRGAAPGSFAPLVKRVVPAVVNISVIEQGTSPASSDVRDRVRGRKEAVLGAGSGFIVDPSGIIVTNTHVVGRSNRITVTLADGTELAAQLIGSDELTDIAVISVKSPKPLPYVQWGDSKVVEVGDWILAAGNPFGVGISVTAGIVSARGRDIGAGPFDDFLQIDAPINPGNSGGPTFNMEGQVIAVNTAIVSPTGGSVGIGFAVPSEMAAKIVNDLRDKGRIERGWLGVSVQDVTSRNPRVPGGLGSTGPGVSIANIDRSGPAAKAGLRTGDIVMAVNGDRVDTAQGLIKAVAAVAPGKAVQLTVRRNGQNLEVAVTVGLRPAEQQG